MEASSEQSTNLSRIGKPAVEVIPVTEQTRRKSRGRLAGRLILNDVWDSPSVNQAIAEEFGLTR